MTNLPKSASPSASFPQTRADIYRQRLSLIRSVYGDLFDAEFKSASPSFWVIERFENEQSQGYWAGDSSRDFVKEIDKAIQFCRREDAWRIKRGWHWTDTKVTEHLYMKSASPSEPDWNLIVQEIFNKSVLDSEEGEIWQDVSKAVSILKKYFAAEHRSNNLRVRQYEDRIPCGRCGHVHLGCCSICNNCPQIEPPAAEPGRDEREAPLTRFDVYPWLNETIKASGWNVGRLIQLVEAKGHLEDLADTILAWQASRASAAVPQTANEILQTLKFAKEVIDDQVARFHEGCRCQLCESLPESLQRAIELLESSKISAVPQPLPTGEKK